MPFDEAVPQNRGDQGQTPKGFFYSLEILAVEKLHLKNQYLKAFREF